MNITEIFARILKAPKITNPTLVAIIVAGVIYLLGEKLGIVKDEDLITTIIIAMFSTFILVLAINVYLEMYKHDNNMKGNSKDDSKGNIMIVNGNSNTSLQDVKNSTIQNGNQNKITNIEKQINQSGDKSLYIEENKGNIKIN